MRLRLTVTDHKVGTREAIVDDLLARGLVQNVETTNRPQIFGDFVETDNVEAFMVAANVVKKIHGCQISIELG